MAESVAVSADLQGTIVGWFVEVGAHVGAGHVLALVESMKLHHEVISPVDGVVDSVAVGEGDTVTIGQELARITEGVREVSARLVRRAPTPHRSGWNETTCER